MRYINYLKGYVKYLKKTYDIARDNQALNLLSDVVQEMPRNLPHTGSALSFRALQVICADLVINRRELVVELGTGYSTIFLSKFRALRNLNFRIIAFEENEDWSKIVEDTLASNGLSESAAVQFSPIEEGWYKKEVIDHALNSVQPDVLLIDGPVASDIADIRRHGLTFFEDKLKSRNMIVLDDIDRKSEYAMLLEHQKKTNARWHIDGTTAFHLAGVHYNIF